MEVDALTLAENINRGGRYEVTMNHDSNQVWWEQQCLLFSETVSFRQEKTAT
jgi:hypothetical protein